MNKDAYIFMTKCLSDLPLVNPAKEHYKDYIINYINHQSICSKILLIWYFVFWKYDQGEAK